MQLQNGTDNCRSGLRGVIKILGFFSLNYVSHKPESVADFGTCCWTKANCLKSAIPLLKLFKRNTKKLNPEIPRFCSGCILEEGLHSKFLFKTWWKFTASIISYFGIPCFESKRNALVSVWKYNKSNKPGGFRSWHRSLRTWHNLRSHTKQKWGHPFHFAYQCFQISFKREMCLRNIWK